MGTRNSIKMNLWNQYIFQKYRQSSSASFLCFRIWSDQGWVHVGESAWANRVESTFEWRTIKTKPVAFRTFWNQSPTQSKWFTHYHVLCKPSDNIWTTLRKWHFLYGGYVWHHKTTVSNIYANAKRKTENRHENKVPCWACLLRSFVVLTGAWHTYVQ